MRRWPSPRTFLPSGRRWQGRAGSGALQDWADGQVASSGSNITLEYWTASGVSGTTTKRHSQTQSRVRANRTMRTLALAGLAQDQDFPHEAWHHLRPGKDAEYALQDHVKGKELLHDSPIWAATEEEKVPEIVIAAKMDHIDPLALEKISALEKALDKYDRDVIADLLSELDGSALLQLEPAKLHSLLQQIDRLGQSIYELDDLCISILGHYWRCLKLLPNSIVASTRWAYTALIDTLLRTGAKSQRSIDTAKIITLFLEKRNLGLKDGQMCSILNQILQIAGPAYAQTFIQEIVALGKRDDLRNILTISLSARLLNSQPIFKPHLKSIIKAYQCHNCEMPEKAFELLVTRYVMVKDDRQLKETLEYMKDCNTDPSHTIFAALLHPDGPIKNNPETLRATLLTLQETGFEMDKSIANLILSALLDVGLIKEIYPFLRHFEGLKGLDLATTIGVDADHVAQNNPSASRQVFQIEHPVLAKLKAKAEFLETNFAKAEVVRRLDRLANTLSRGLTSEVNPRYLGEIPISRQKQMEIDRVIITSLRHISHRVGHFDGAQFREYLSRTNDHSIEGLFSFIKGTYKKKGFFALNAQISEAARQSTFGSPVPFQTLPLQAYPWIVRLALQLSSDARYGLEIIEQLTRNIDTSSYSRVISRCWAELIDFPLQDFDRQGAMEFIEKAIEALKVRDEVEPRTLVHLWLPVLKFLAKSDEPDSFFEAWDWMSETIPDLHLRVSGDGTATLTGRLNAINREVAHHASSFASDVNTVDDYSKYPWTLWATLFKMLATIKPSGDKSIIEIISALDLVSFEPHDLKRLSWMFSDLLGAHARLGDLDGLFRSIDTFLDRMKDRSRQGKPARSDGLDVDPEDLESGNEKQSLPFIDKNTLREIKELLSHEVEHNRISNAEADDWYDKIRRLQRRGLPQ